MATFAIIILLVGLIMGAYQSRLLNRYFRSIASDQLVQQARNMGLLISRISLSPPSDSALTRSLVSVISSMTSSRVLVTDTRGVILVDSSNGLLVGQQVAPQYLRETLEQGQIETFDFPVAGTDAVGAAVPWRTGNYITGAMILVKPLSAVARQSTLQAARFMARAGILAMAVALALSYVLASNITEPLTRMAQVARSISKGDFRQRVDIDSKDELGDLAQAMNSMSREISVLVENLTQEKEKLKALNEERKNMMSDISHDLRTPLTSIRGFVEALQDGVITDPEEQKRTLEIIHDETQRLSRLVDDLFYLARLESGDIPVEMVPLDFADVVRSSVNAVRPQSIEKNLELRLTTDEGVRSGKAMVKGSADRLTRAVLNLLDNAIKYSPEGGIVEVSLSIAAESPGGPDEPPGATQGTPETQHASSRGRMVLTISDQGPGIPKEAIPHIFERFYRADKSRARMRSSAGLGLSIAKFIVDQHGGSISVESELGKGTTMRIELPLLTTAEGSLHT